MADVAADTETTVENSVSVTAYKPLLMVKPHKFNQAVTFYKEVFDATEIGPSLYYPKRKADQELLHIVSTELKLAGTTIVVSGSDFDDVEALNKRTIPAILEAAVAKAVGGGALKVEEAFSDEAKVIDPFGLTWIIVTAAKKSNIEFVTFTACKPLLIVEAQKLKLAVDFYKEAFDATETGRSPYLKRKADKDLPHFISAQLKLAGTTIVVSDLSVYSASDVEASVDVTKGATLAILETHDLKASVNKALAARALKVEEEVSDNTGVKVVDPFGCSWVLISQPKQSQDKENIERVTQVIVNPRLGQCFMWDCRRPGQPHYCSQFHATLAAQESTAEFPAFLKRYVNSKSEGAYSEEEKVICMKALACRKLSMPSGFTELGEDTLASAPYTLGIFSTDLENEETERIWFFYYPKCSFPWQNIRTGAKWRIPRKDLRQTVSDTVESIKRYCGPQPADGSWNACIYYQKESQGAGEWSVCCLRYTKK